MKLTNLRALQLLARNGIMTGNVLLVKAKELADKLTITKGSQGWPTNLKHRHAIHLVTRHGELGAANNGGISQARAVVSQLITGLGYSKEVY